MVYVGNGYLVGKWPPFLKGGYLPCLRVIKNLVTSHNESYRAIKKIKKNVVVVGIAKNNMYFHATTRNPLHRLSAAFMGWFWNKRFLGKIAHHLDFIGLNYYVHRAVGPSRQHEKSDMGWDIYPEGIYHVLKELARFERPIYVTENGIADEGDSKRKGFIIDHLRYVHKAIEEGVGVHGYFYWSLMDNYEWAEGFSRRFGLLEVDYSTKRRKMRESAFAYKEICGNNSITI
jgi:beta-glucosidase